MLLQKCILYNDITGFVGLIKSIYESKLKSKRIQLVEKLMNDKDLGVEYLNPETGKKILKHNYTEIIPHELDAAKKLTTKHFDIIFAPKSMFERGEKRFDIYAIKYNNILNADIKTNLKASQNAIFNAVMSGSKQANSIIFDIKSKIKNKPLIAGLKEGVEKSSNIETIHLFYKNRYFNLTRKTILSKEIYKVLK